MNGQGIEVTTYTLWGTWICVPHFTAVYTITVRYFKQKRECLFPGHARGNITGSPREYMMNVNELWMFLWKCMAIWQVGVERFYWVSKKSDLLIERHQYIFWGPWIFVGRSIQCVMIFHSKAQIPTLWKWQRKHRGIIDHRKATSLGNHERPCQIEFKFVK